MRRSVLKLVSIMLVIAVFAIPQSSVFAYTGGVLNGTMMYQGYSVTTSENGKVGGPTDNDESVYSQLYPVGSGNTFWEWIGTQSIGSYRLKATFGSLKIELLASNGDILYSVFPTTNGGITYIPSAINNVAKVVLINTDKTTSSNVYELDFFAVPAPTPTPTPTPTPSAPDPQIPLMTGYNSIGSKVKVMNYAAPKTLKSSEILPYQYSKAQSNGV